MTKISGTQVFLGMNFNIPNLYLCIIFFAWMMLTSYDFNIIKEDGKTAFQKNYKNTPHPSKVAQVSFWKEDKSK